MNIECRPTTPLLSPVVCAVKTAAIGSLAMWSVAVWTAVPLAGQDRALSIEDYYRLETVQAPRISPDGAWVAYTVSTPIEETNESDMAVWVADFDGARSPERVAGVGNRSLGVEWVRDGQLRVTDSDGNMWLVDPERPTEARAHAAEEAGLLSPDGRWIAEVREVPRPARPEPAMSDFERRHQERFAGEDFDWYPFRRDGQRFPLPDGRERAAAELFIRSADADPESARALTDLGLRVDNVTWSPDGTYLLFTADESILDEIDYPRTDLFRVSVDGDLTRMSNDGYQYSNIGISPDGRWLSYMRSFGTDMIREQALDHGGPRDLYVRPTSGGPAINLTRDWDLDPGSSTWTSDSRAMVFPAGIGGGIHLFQVDVAEATVHQVTDGERRLLNIDFDDAVERMTYRVGSFDRPSEVYVASIDGTGERRVSHVTDAFVASVDLASTPTERIRYESYDGTPVEGFLMYPHGYDETKGPYPLIVVNHGGPHAASGYSFNFKNHLFAANGYFVFLPNFRGSTGYGDDFKWGIWGAWGGNDGEDVMAGVDHLIDRYGIDRARVGSTGHSYGGILTNWLITHYPDRFKAAVSGAGASNWTSNYALSDVARTKELEFFGRPWEPRAREIMIRQSAYLNSGGVKAATLFVHGEEDYRVPLEGAIQLYTSLKKQRVPTRLVIYEGMAHGIRGHWNGVHRMINELGWWEQYLKPTGQTRADVSH